MRATPEPGLSTPNGEPATRMRTEVLPTTVFLELSVGNIEAAAAVCVYTNTEITVETV